MKCPSDAFVELSAQIMGGGSLLRFQARGGSMYPVLRPGDILWIEPFSARTRGLRPGDVIFYESGQGRMVVHRIVAEVRSQRPGSRPESGALFIVRGDAVAGGAYEEVPEGRVRGRLKAIERDGRRKAADGAAARLLGLLSVAAYPFRARARRFAGRLVRRVQSFGFYPRLVKKILKRPCVYAWQEAREGTAELYARRNGRVVARATLHHFAAEGVPYQGWWLFGVEVTWPNRRLGIAGELVEAVCRRAAREGASEVRTVVFKDNRPALGLYQKSGFYEVGVLDLVPALRQELRSLVRPRTVLKRVV